MKWFRTAAENGHNAAQVILGDELWKQAKDLFGNVRPRDEDGNRRVQETYQEAFYWFRQAAEAGYAVGQYRLGSAHFAYREYEKAKEWFERAANQGHPEAQYRLGLLYWDAGSQEDPYGSDRDVALTWFKAAADSGHPAAQTLYGRALMQGNGLPQNESEGLAWIGKAASVGHADAEELLAWAYRKGRGVPQDALQADIWNQRAVSHGSESALRNTVGYQIRKLIAQTSLGWRASMFLDMARNPAFQALQGDATACDSYYGFSCNRGVDMLGLSIWQSIP
jgi:TPR repeat protein